MVYQSLNSEHLPSLNTICKQTFHTQFYGEKEEEKEEVQKEKEKIQEKEEEKERRGAG